MPQEYNKEPLRVLNEDGTLSDRSVTRGAAHKNGILHGASHIYLYTTDDQGQIFFLLQRRSPKKDSYPNCLDTSAAGHMEAGMDFLSTAHKELEEELGLKSTDCPLQEAFVYRCDKTETFHGKVFRNREIFTVYFAKIPMSTHLHPQQEEISEILWMEDRIICEHLASGDREFCMDSEVFSRVLEIIRAKE